MWEQFILLPVWYQYTIIFIFGTIIGSFLDVFTLRFHTGRSINGRSHCLSCGHDLRWYELLPLVSYLTQRGRCNKCSSYIPVRLLMMELLVGGLFLLSFTVARDLTDFFLTTLLLIVLVVIGIYDYRHMIIPDKLTITVCLLALLIFFVSLPSFLYGKFFLNSLLSAVGAFSFFAGLWLVSKGKWIGFGDAKLALPLGFMLGPWATFSFVIFSFWIGAIVSLLLIFLQKMLRRGQKHLPFMSLPLTIKSEVPFAPFMIASFVLVYLTGADVLRLMSIWFYGQ